MIARLVEAFNHPEESVRRGAARAVRRCATDPKESVELLCFALVDADVFAHLAALEILEDVQTTASDALQACIERAGWSEVLPELLSVLTTALESEPVEYAHQLARRLLSRLERSGPLPAEVSFALKAGSSDRRVGREIKRLKKAGISACGAALADPDWRVACAACNVLRELGTAAEQALPSLLSALEHPDAQVRGSAALATGYVSSTSTRGLTGLTKALEDADAEVRREAAHGLACLGATAAPASSALVPLLASRGSRASAFAVFEKIGSAAVPSLVQGLAHGNEAIRKGAADALARIGENATDAISALVAALAENGTGMGVETADGYRPPWPDSVGSAASNALGRIGLAALPALLSALRSPNGSVRCGAARSLGQLRATGVVEALSASLTAESVEVRRAARESLRTLEPDADDADPEPTARANSSISALTDALASKDVGLRSQAITALMLQVTSGLSQEAADALASARHEAIPTLIEGLRHHRAPVRRLSADALGSIAMNHGVYVGGPADPRLVSALVESLDDSEKTVSLSAAVALRWLGREAVEAIPSRWQGFVGRAFIDRNLS